MTGHQGNRYGRSEEARVKIVNAADDLLAEKGFAATTIEGIAKRAGVSKQTIYRWWPAKTDVLLEALVTDATERLSIPDCGSLAADVRAAVAAHVHFLAEDDAGRVLVALAAHARLDPAFAADFDASFLIEQREREAAPLRRAIARDELGGDTDVTLACATLYGPLHMMTGEQLLHIDIDDYVARWLRSVRRD